MDYDKLIDDLQKNGHNKKLTAWVRSTSMDAATAIESLRAESEKLRTRNTKLEDTVRSQRNGLQELRDDLARVTAERDAAEKEVRHLKAVMREKGVMTIPARCPWERPEWNV